MSVAAVALILVAACARPLPVPRVEISTASSGTAVFAVEIADDEEARSRGAIGRSALPNDAGIAFVWPADTDVRFHMLGVSFPLQIAFADGGGRIVRILDMTPCAAPPCEAYDAGTPFRTALEVNAGALTRAGVREGDRLRLVR